MMSNLIVTPVRVPHERGDEPYFALPEGLLG